MRGVKITGSESTQNFHYQINNRYNHSSLNNTIGIPNPQELTNSCHTKIPESNKTINPITTLSRIKILGIPLKNSKERSHQKNASVQ